MRTTGVCALLSSSLYGCISSSTIHTSLSICFLPLISFHHSYQFPYHSIHSIHLKISPDPLLRALPHLQALCLFPRPRAWEERASMMMVWWAWMIGAGGAVVFVPLIRLSAHSLLSND